MPKNDMKIALGGLKDYRSHSYTTMDRSTLTLPSPLIEGEGKTDGRETISPSGSDDGREKYESRKLSDPLILPSREGAARACSGSSSKGTRGQDYSGLRPDEQALREARRAYGR